MNTINPDEVLSVIKQHTQDRPATKRLIAQRLGLPYANTNNNATDRAIRDAVTELRKLGHPVISSSGKAGYWYDPDSVDMLIADYTSRIADMSDTVRALRRGRATVRQLELV